jgi:hypothetical protein
MLLSALPKTTWASVDLVTVQNVELDPEDVNIEGLYVDKRNNVITIPDVLHQLHCLVSANHSSASSATHSRKNQIRMALADDADRTDNDPRRQMHVGP